MCNHLLSSVYVVWCVPDRQMQGCVVPVVPGVNVRTPGDQVSDRFTGQCLAGPMERRAQRDISHVDSEPTIAQKEGHRENTV